MPKFITRILLTAITFAFILPLIPGIHFHGNFGIAIVAALLFGIAGWIVDLVAILLSAVFTVTTFGVALLWLIPLWILGFWLLPAVTLKVVADAMPAQLTVHGWMPAVEGGLVLFLIGMFTSSKKDQVKRR